MNFIKDLKSELLSRRNPDNAVAMSTYMKDKFPFLGIKSPERKTVLQGLVNVYKRQLAKGITKATVDLYTETEREFHYCGMEL